MTGQDIDWETISHGFLRATVLLLPLLEYGLLVFALKIIWTTSVKQVVNAYRYQCFLLALVTFVSALATLLRDFRTAGDGADHKSLLALVVTPFVILVLPVGLGLLAKRLLLAATSTVPSPAQKGNKWFYFPIAKLTTAQETEAMETWRDASEQAVHVHVADVVAFVAILVLAALVSRRFAALDTAETVGLTASLTLHLVGLYLMSSKRDLISQTIGLLVMDHGLYLAVVKIVELPVPGLLFVFGLFCYTLITLFILVYLVPQVRLRVREGIGLDGIAACSDLKG